MILAIDFDGTLSQSEPRRPMGIPRMDAVKTVEGLFHAGHHIVIHTVKARHLSGKQAVMDWLHFYKIPFDEVTAIKPNADIFLDDKAIRYTTWLEFQRIMERMESK